MKRTLAIALALIMLLGILAGCGNTKSGSSKGMEEITILYPGDEADRFTEFLNNEFAERMKNDLNMKVNVVFVPWDQYWDKKDIMLANQEAIDLYWDGLPDLSTMVNKKQCQPIDELLEKYGQDMLKVLPMDYIKGAVIDGNIYGIPSCYAPSSAMFQFVCLRQDILEAVGMDSVSTPEDLMEYSKRATEKFDNIKGGGDPIFKPLARYYGEEQYNWIAAQDLVVFGEDSHKAYDWYETEAFQTLCQFNREMTLAGQYTDDVTIKYNERDSRMQTGNYLWVEGSLGKDTEIIDTVRANAPDATLGNYLLAPEKTKYMTAAGGEVICIPYSAPNPEGAMKFLNWLYASQDNYLFALYGVEGKDYEIVDGRLNRLINDDLFYEWMFRNRNYQLFTAEVDQDYIDTYEHWDDDAVYSASFGFRFNNENVKEIEARLIEVAQKHFVQLETGFVDFETEYPKAIQAMKDAGIDEYVAEVQRQLDAFLAQQ